MENTYQMICNSFYISNGRYCDKIINCPYIHIIPKNKICIPTYSNQYCWNGCDCTYKHFLPYKFYCHNYFLFDYCVDNNCSLIHLSKKTIIYNLLSNFKNKFINLYIIIIRQYYNKIYLRQHNTFLEDLKKEWLLSYNIADFRTNARCIICFNKVSDEITPNKRVRILLTPKSLYNIPKELIRSYIAPYILPKIKHTSCLYLRQKETDAFLLQLYERRYVRRDVLDPAGNPVANYVSRAIPIRYIPKIHLDDIATTAQKLSSHLPNEIVRIVLDRAVEFLPVKKK